MITLRVPWEYPMSTWARAGARTDEYLRGTYRVLTGHSQERVEPERWVLEGHSTGTRRYLQESSQSAKLNFPEGVARHLFAQVSEFSQGTRRATRGEHTHVWIYIDRYLYQSLSF